MTGEGEALEVSTKPVADKLSIRPGDRLVVVGLPNDIAPVALEGPDHAVVLSCLLYTSPSPRDGLLSRMPSSA